jgi:steroid delta-isomerase-like uncharacterized protein
MSMSPREAALHWFEHVWNQGSESLIDRMLAKDARMHGLPTSDGQPLVGPGGFKTMYRQMRAAIPDIRFEVVRSVEEGNMVAVHCRVTGTHRGDDLGVAATGRPIEIWGMGMARVENGVIAEAWNSFDFMTLYQSVGLLPPLPQA